MGPMADHRPVWRVVAMVVGVEKEGRKEGEEGPPLINRRGGVIVGFMSLRLVHSGFKNTR